MLFLAAKPLDPPLACANYDVVLFCHELQSVLPVSAAARCIRSTGANKLAAPSRHSCATTRVNSNSPTPAMPSHSGLPLRGRIGDTRFAVYRRIVVLAGVDILCGQRFGQLIAREAERFAANGNGKVFVR